MANRLDRDKEKYKQYGRKWIRDDVITMRLDMTGEYGVLSYEFNEPIYEDLGMAWDDLDVNETYCLGVWIGNPNTVQLMNDEYESVWIYP